ncbi:putative leucine-rich repeat-containing protein DDB_G0290503 isoform X2 [Ischnura elegans]|uniref:putative leucine-rich repeat-containing protein DDB_G0290503 isoform X2 n=1 Tax=Ischnura elegans TaxID=197161 RepID=UPI001ED8A073|nr:putative leucine-rich repeat-containing protein DDB_G0290503 isoform X2 [Ischnura elegans]
MSFGKSLSPRLGDATPKDEAPSLSKGNVSGSHTNLATRRQLLSTPTKTSQRSRSLSASTKIGGSTTNLASNASKYGGASKIPVQSKDKQPIAKRSPSVGARTKSRSRLASPVPAVKSAATATTPRASTPLKLPRASTPNAASGNRPPTAASTPGTPRARSPSRISGRLNQTAPAKRPTPSPQKTKPVPGIKRETSKLSGNSTLATNVTKVPSQKNVGVDEEIIKETNLANSPEKKILTKVSRPKEVKIDMKMINDLLNVVSEECFSLCSELSEHKNCILVNLIDFHDGQGDGEILSEKIDNYLKGGDGIFLRYKLLKQSQYDISNKLYGLVSELNLETIALRDICGDYEHKLDLLETENENVSKQMKVLSEELESEKEKMTALNQKKTLLEQQVKKHAQRIKELETKSTSSDGKIYQQSTQLKSYEAQLKLKDEKYQALEVKLNQQAKQCRMAMEVREKLEKQRESLEARVSDLKKLKAEQQVDSAKSEEKLREELEEAQKRAENEKQQREILEKELATTQERLISVQEKSLQLADVTEVSRATIVQEGALKTSEKEAQLQLALNEIQLQLEKANEDVENFKKVNDHLRAAVHQATDNLNKITSNEDVSSIISILKSEIATKDETIRSLRQQMDSYLKEANDRCDNLKEMEKRWKEDKANDYNEDHEALWQEILDLRHRLIQAEKDNQKYLQLVAQKQLEIEQRERVMREQAKVLQVRDELLKLLRKKDKTKTGQMSALQAKLEDQERNADTVNRFFQAKTEQLQEIYSTLEIKQRRVMQLEEEVKQLVAQNERGQCQRTKLEARIAELELAVHEKGRTSCSSSVYNPRCKSTYSTFLIHPSCIHSCHREPQEVYCYPMNHSIDYPRQHSTPKVCHHSRLSHVNRKPYSRHNDKTRSVFQIYKISSSRWGDSNCGSTSLHYHGS